MYRILVRQRNRADNANEMKTSYELTTYAGRPYFLKIRATPNLENPEEFAVTVYFNDPDRREGVDVARIDTDHGYTHLDKLFLERQPKERMNVGLWDAVEHLIEHHPEYARKYRERRED